MRWPPFWLCLTTLVLPPTAAGDAGEWLIDDRASGSAVSTLGPSWRFFSDGVMGGVSSGSLRIDTMQGRSALCLRGQVRLENNGGFVQMALDLPVPGLPVGPHLANLVCVGTFGAGGHDSADDPVIASVYAALKAAGVRLSVRRGTLRFSLHLYNNDSDVDGVLEIARRWRAGHG